MSLQRVLETARKTGMPVIMTDLGGREPMVILPLEQFEAMAGVPATPVSRPKPSIPRPPVDDVVDQALADMAAERLLTRMEEAAVQLEPEPQKGAETPDFSLEERFYLEPEDDK